VVLTGLAPVGNAARFVVICSEQSLDWVRIARQHTPPLGGPKENKMKRWRTLLITLVVCGFLALALASFHQPSTTVQSSSPFFVLLGLLMIGIGLLSPQLNRWVGMRERSSVFTEPRFQRTARTTEKVSRIVGILLGVGFLMQGVGSRFLTSEVASTVSLVALGLAGLGILIMFGVVMANWRA
jgi:membrane associated rhomboid family serine protease